MCIHSYVNKNVGLAAVMLWFKEIYTYIPQFKEKNIDGNN